MAQVIIKKFSPKTHKIKAVIYGGSWSWKTSFGGTCPNPIFASAEGWLLSIAHINPDYVEIKSLEDLSGLLTYLKTQPHEYKTVIIDSITEISEIIKADIQKRSGKMMEQRDWWTLAKKIRDILVGFRNLDMHVLFIAQEKVEKDGDQVIKTVPSLNGKAADEIAYFMDIVGYLMIDSSTNERKIITATNQKLATKDRTRMIGNNTHPDFMEWIEAVKWLQVVKEEETVYDQNLDSSGAIDDEDDKTPATTPKTSPQATGTSTGTTTARKAPEKDASEAQVKLLSQLVADLTVSIEDGEKLLKIVRKTILDKVAVDVGPECTTIEEMLKKLKSSQASTLIEYLKAQIKSRKEKKEETPAPVETAPAT